MHSHLRLLVPQLPTPDKSVPLPKEEAHHLRVLRKNAPLEVVLLDGKSACVAMLEGRMLHFIRLLPVPRNDTFPLTLAFGLLKQEALHWMIEKVTELGLESLQPLHTAHSVAKAARRDKWQHWADAALKQSTRQRRLRIAVASDVERALELPGHHLFCDEKGGASLQDWMLRTRQESKDLLRSGFTVWVGPEGGWSEEERKACLESKRLTRISLGPRRLRAETACLHVVSLLSLLLESHAKHT